MNIRKTLMAVSAISVLAASGATAAYADPHDRHHDRDRHATVVHHDRYWRDGYREGRYVDRDRVFTTLRAHHYARFVGDPYWYDGRYVVRTYDRDGRVIFVEVNPYTGGFVGVVRF